MSSIKLDWIESLTFLGMFLEGPDLRVALSRMVSISVAILLKWKWRDKNKKHEKNSKSKVKIIRFFLFEHVN